MKTKFGMLTRRLVVSLLAIQLAAAALAVSAADGDLTATIQQLEGALRVNPDNGALHYYLGNLYLRAGDPMAAIRHWDQFVAGGGDDSRTVSVREQLTVLKMNQARDFARKAVAEGDAEAAPAEANTVAVLEFTNGAERSYDPFVKGMTAMIITDLSKVPQLKVVERARMQALADEMKLGLVGVVDANTSARVGRLLQAQTINWGELKSPTNDVLRVRTVVSDTVSHSTVGEAVAEGRKEAFFEMEKKLVFDILAHIGINREDLPEEVVRAIEEVETTNYNAFILFGTGLMYLDNRNYAEAKQAFAEAANLDPGFTMADTAEKTTPVVDTVAVGYTAEEEQNETVATVAPAPADAGATTSPSTVSTTTPATTPSSQTSAVFAVAEPQNVAQESLDATQAAIDVTTDVVQDETVIDTAAGPTLHEGYFTNILRNAAGTYHGIYFVSMRTNLADGWEAFSTWPNGHATGVEETFESLVVVDNLDPITTGLPHDVQWTEIGSTSYMAWGKWTDDIEMVRQSNPTSPSGHYLFDATGYYVYGDSTTNAQMTELTASEIYALYTGDAYATHAAAPNTVMTGSFEATVGFFMGGLDVSGFNLSVAGGSHSASIADAFGYNMGTTSDFHIMGGTWMVDGQPLQPFDFAEGSGSFYGPGAEFMGGIFWIEKDAGANSVEGVFAGEFTSTIQ